MPSVDSKILQTQQVVYVEPNAISGEDDFGAYTPSVMKAPSLEDYCIVVDLEVEIKGRTFSSTSNVNGNVLKMEYTESNGGKKINFMSGSKIYLDEKKSKYITSLTTDYTKTYLTDVVNGGTCEMFGITSVEVSYNNFMVPQVTIQFVDVRGVSLFAQEENRHNMVRDGITGSVNQDLEGSFFRSFFLFPYPKFTLTVKGFYGQPVSYELTCSEFNSTFDSSTGNFNVTVKFVGYAFSFLSDIMANAVLAAPYSPYLGKDYWEVNNGTRFTVFDKNGLEKPMKTLPEIVGAFSMVQQQVADAMSNENLIDNPDISQDIKDALFNPDLKPLYQLYKNLLKALANLESVIPDINGENHNMIFKAEGSNSVVIVDDDANHGSDSLNKTFKENAKVVYDLATQVNSKVNELTFKSDLLASWYKQYNGVKVIGHDGTSTVDNEDFITQIDDDGLKGQVKQAYEQYKDDWQNNFNSSYFIYNDYGLGKIFSQDTNHASTESESGDTQPNAEQLKSELANQMMNQKFEEVFDFPPTVENMTRIFMAHTETFVQMVCDCSSNIINSGVARSLSNLGISVDDFVDAGKTDESTLQLPPFPKVTKEVEKEGVTKREDAWIGEYGDENKFEEIKLVEGILKGIESAAVPLNFTPSVSASGNTSDGTLNCAVPHPTSLMDIFMTGNKNPFGKIDFSNASDTLSRFAMRAFVNIAMSDASSQDAIEIGKQDALNFIELFSNDSQFQTIKNYFATHTEVVTQSGSDNTPIMNALLHGKKGLNGTELDKPWGKTDGVMYKIKGTDYLTCQYANVHVYQSSNSSSKDIVSIFPVCDWDWNQYRDLITTDSKYRYVKGTSYNFVSSDAVDKFNDTWEISIFRDISYVSRAISKLEEGSYLKNKFSKYAYSRDNLIGWRTLFLGTYDNGKLGSITKNGLSYDDTGKITSPEKLTMYQMGSIFCTNNEFYSGDKSIRELAKVFLISLMRDNTETKNFFRKALTNYDENNSIGVYYMPYCSVLYIGAMMNTGSAYNKFPLDGNQLIRNSIAVKFKKEFNDWADKKFPLILNKYKLSLKNNIPSKLHNGNTVLIENVKKMSNDLDKTYKVIDNQLIAIPCTELGDIISELFSLTTVAKKCNCYARKGAYTNGATCLKYDSFVNYMHSVVQQFRETLGLDNEDGTDPQSNGSASATANLQLGEDSDDIRIGVYNYIKLLYDKWLSADLSNDFYKMETLFGGDSPAFYFIDSAYNKIGKSLYINIGLLADQLKSSQTANGLPLLSMLSGMYADNKFSMLFIQNFADRADPTFMSEMFKPIPYIQMKPDKRLMNYIVMYPYEASSKLDIEGADYPDDTFYLNDSTSWPIMISSKRPGTDLAIPAFGVTYGQQYQSYFSTIQVGMDSPMATEQSIKAKFMLAGAGTNGDNNGPRHVTTGQDLYTIYANNSYTCTVTMMGCMWVQPMMYFVLNNVPMFRGSYMIIKVNHKVEPGNMTTTFTGVRMARTSTRGVEQYLYMFDTAGGGDGVDAVEAFNHANANVGNDCEYAFYSPLGGDGEDFSTDLSKRLYDVLPGDGKALLDGKWGTNGTAFKNWTVLDALSAISWKEFGGTADTAVANRVAVISCMYNYRGCAGADAFKKYIFQSGWRYFVGTNSTLQQMRNDLLKIYNSKDMATAKALVKDVWTNGPYKYLVGKPNKLGGTITLEQVQKGFTTRGTSDTQKTKDMLSSYGPSLYQLEPYAGFTHIVGGLNQKPFQNGFVAKPKPNPKNETEKINTLKSGLTASVQSSLKATQVYANTTVTGTFGAGTWLKLTATGNNATNAVFDCLIETYADYFDAIYWDYGNGNINSDAKAIIVRVTTTTNSNICVGICHNFAMNTTNPPTPYVRYNNTNDVNETLKLAMIKYFTKKNITNASKAKSVFRAIQNLADSTVVTFFELDKNSGADSIEDCSSLAGYPSAGGASIGTNGNTDKESYLRSIFGGTIPTSDEQVQKYIVKFNVNGRDANGNDCKVSIKAHKALQAEIVAIANELKTAGFCWHTVADQSWRKTAGGSLSNHAYGIALDVNPGSAGNPWFSIKSGESISPTSPPPMKYSPYHGKYNEKTCIWTWNHKAVAIFNKHGWGWGGGYGDVMHFSKIVYDCNGKMGGK